MLLFDAQDLCWLGSNDVLCAVRFGTLVGLGAGILIIVLQQRLLPDSDFLLYWVVCSTAFTVLASLYFVAQNIAWFGLNIGQSGLGFGALVTLSTGMLAVRRRTTNTRPGSYW